jgi:hypothetical protein
MRHSFHPAHGRDFGLVLPRPRWIAMPATEVAAVINAEEAATGGERTSPR